MSHAAARHPLCTGCGACTAACRTERPARGHRGAATPRTRGARSKRGNTFVRRMCMHCESPTCASVCPVGAMKKSPEGPVLYDPKKCIGCYCIKACPFDVPVPVGPERSRRGQVHHVPAASREGRADGVRGDIYPTGATKFGKRGDLVRGPGTHRRDAGPLRGPHLRTARGRRHVGAHAVRGAVRPARPAHEPAGRTARQARGACWPRARTSC